MYWWHLGGHHEDGDVTVAVVVQRCAGSEPPTGVGVATCTAAPGSLLVTPKSALVTLLTGAENAAVKEIDGDRGWMGPDEENDA